MEELVKLVCGADTAEQVHTTLVDIERLTKETTDQRAYELMRALSMVIYKHKCDLTVKP